MKKKVKVSILELLEEKINIDRLLDNVAIREDQLIEALLMQPTLTKDAGIVRVQSFRKKTLYETRLKLSEAKAGLRLRRIRDVGGRKEFTEGAVKERIQLEPIVQKTRKRLDNALVEEEMCKLLMEVFRTRGNALNNIIQAGKVSIHAKELEYLKANKVLSKGVQRLRDRWERGNDNGEDN